METSTTTTTTLLSRVKEKSSLCLHSRFMPNTFSGLKFDVLKSALQKFCRRGMEKEAEWCAVECFLIQFETQHDDNEQIRKKGRSMVTNILNRVKTIAFEDVSYRECVAVNGVFSKLKQFEDGGRKNPQHLLDAINFLVRSRKSRVASHAFSHFSKRNNNTFDHKTISECTDDVYRSIIDGDRDAVIGNVILAYRLWQPKTKKKQNFRELWDVLTEAALAFDPPVQEAIRNRRDYFFDRNSSFRDERSALVSAALMITHFGSNYNNYNPSEFDLAKIRDVEDYAYLLLNHSPAIEFPSFVFDIHTKSGPPSNKTYSFFYNQSSVITNEDEIVAVPDWKTSYAVEIGEKDNINITAADELVDLNPSDIVCVVPKTKKVPCIFWPQKNIVMKEMKSQFDYGVQQLCVERLKSFFGLKGVNGRLVSWQYQYSNKYQRCVRASKSIPYFVMDIIPDDPQPVSKHKNRLVNSEKLQTQLYQILLFRMILGVSDTGLCNILIQKNTDQLFSVDENAIGYWSIEERKGLPLQVKGCLKMLRKMSFPSALADEIFNNVWGPEVRENHSRLIRKQLQRCKVPGTDQKMAVIESNGWVVKRMFDEMFQ